MKKLAVLFSFVAFSAQVGYSQQIDSIIATQKIQRNRFTIRQLQVPLTLTLMGLAASGNANRSIKNYIVRERNEHMPHFKTHIDNYLQYSPIAIVYGLDAMGIRAKNDIANRTAMLIRGELFMLATVSIIKDATNQLRPDGTDYSSFPSGHTAQAFATATFLSMEYKDRFPWMPYAAYGLASTVGMMRMANNRHYISDVLLGAGIGILSMKASYWTHQYRWGKKKQLRLLY